MPRVKVIAEAADLVPLFRAFDSELKRAVFDELTQDWMTETSIQEAYGSEGVEALGLLENAHLVETRWTSSQDGPEKAYRSFYTGIQLNMESSAGDLGDLLGAATLDPEAFRSVEAELEELAGDGVSFKTARERLEVSSAMLQGLLKRSTQVDAKGQKIVLRE